MEEPEDIFRKTVACSLKRLNGEHMKEYAKLKIQEVFFRYHSSQNQQSSAPCRTPETNQSAYVPQQFDVSPTYSPQTPISQSQNSPSNNYTSQLMGQTTYQQINHGYYATQGHIIPGHLQFVFVMFLLTKTVLSYFYVILF